MKLDMDELLKRVLTPEEEPGEDLNGKILKQVKEEGTMKKRRYMCASVVAAAALAAAGSLTAYAAWQYRSAPEVAEELGDETLAHALEENVRGSVGDTAEKQPFETGVSQSFGGYTVALLGMVSGEGLSEYQHMSGGQLKLDRTYLAVAIGRE